MPETLNDQIYDELFNKFQVVRTSSEHINKVYTTEILPRIKKHYLAHLIAAIEELINEKRQEEQKKNPEDIYSWETRNFYLGLRQYKPVPGTNADSFFFKNKNVCIIYKGIDTDNIEEVKELRICIAHELGHVLRDNGILKGTGLIENYANVFAYFAIKGKSDFYKNKKTKSLVYKDESEIINKIYNLCQINEYRQQKKKMESANKLIIDFNEKHPSE